MGAVQSTTDVPTSTASSVPAATPTPILKVDPVSPTVHNERKVTASGTIYASDDMLTCIGTGAISLSLPPSAVFPGKQLIVLNTYSGATVTITPYTGDTINQTTSLVLVAAPGAASKCILFATSVGWYSVVSA